MFKIEKTASVSCYFRTGYEKGDTQWGRDQGWRVIRAEECWHKSLTPLMIEVRNQIGKDTPVYLSFDIDAIDPSACPGTGTPEIGGLTTAQALEIVRGCRDLNLARHSIQKRKLLFCKEV
jgi:guanidinobutyrase